MRKKGQTEIFGIIIIVILLIMGLFFIIGSKLKRQMSGSQDYITSEVGQNMLNSMFKADVESGLNIADCIRDVVETDHKCQFNGHSGSLSYSHEAIESMMDATLKEWKKAYSLSITLRKPDGSIDALKTESGQEFQPISNLRCGSLDEKEPPGLLFLPSDEGTIMARLDICKGG